MRIYLLLTLLVCTGMIHAQTKSALFLGNSYTASNNLPDLINQLAMSNGDTLIYDSNTPGGYTFQGHSTNSTSIAKINGNTWDFVVLQEQSQLPSFPPSQVATDVYPYAAMLDSMINTNDSCTETVFFMTWGRKYGDQTNCPYYTPLCTYQGMQERLRTSYLQMTNDHEGVCAAVGSAYWASRTADSTFELYTGDYSHPNINGSYLAACVFYASLWRKSPVGLSFTSSLTTQDAAYLQQIAHNTVFDSLDIWRIGADDVIAGFDHQITGNTVNFTDTSYNATDWYWDFGDGMTDNTVQPSHTYNTAGTYIVTLIASNGCQTDTITQSINISPSGMDGPGTGAFKLYPNPADSYIQIEFTTTSGSVTYAIHDLAGREVRSGVTDQVTTTISLEGLPKGQYILRVGTLEQVFTCH